MPAFPAFVNGAYRSQSPVTDQEALINWYTEIAESPGATSRASLYPTPGVELRATLPAGAGRALFTSVVGGERLFGVFGDKLFEFDSFLTATLRGTVAQDNRPAQIVTNGDGGGQLFIASGGKGYAYDLATNVLTEELASGCTQVGASYGYIIAFDIATSTIRISDLFDATTWDPTQFAQRTIGPDPWQALHVSPYGQVWLPGSQTGEVWYNAGIAPFPFIPDPSGLFPYGIAAPFSITQSGASVVWLATEAEGGYSVLQAQGYNPQRISDHALEFAIASYARVDDAIGQPYSEEGHSFYLLTFPSANVTWCYDFTAKQWHQRATWISEDNEFIYWRPVFHAFAFNRHFMADRGANTLYEMSNRYTSDIEEREIRRMRRTPCLFDENKRIAHDLLELLVDSGNGAVSGQGVNPQFMLRVSDDSGRTWSNELLCGSGPMGNYSQRVFWTRLGTARQRVYEVTCTDPVLQRVTDAFVRARGENAA